MHACPHCKGDLGDLEKVMDYLALDKANGKINFTSACCNKIIKAFSDTSRYFITDIDETIPRQMIGAA